MCFSRVTKLAQPGACTPPKLPPHAQPLRPKENKRGGPPEKTGGNVLRNGRELVPVLTFESATQFTRLPGRLKVGQDHFEIKQSGLDHFEIKQSGGSNSEVIYNLPNFGNSVEYVRFPKADSGNPYLDSRAGKYKGPSGIGRLYPYTFSISNTHVLRGPRPGQPHEQMTRRKKVMRGVV